MGKCGYVTEVQQAEIVLMAQGPIEFGGNVRERSPSRRKLRVSNQEQLKRGPVRAAEQNQALLPLCHSEQDTLQQLGHLAINSKPVLRRLHTPLPG